MYQYENDQDAIWLQKSNISNCYSVIVLLIAYQYKEMLVSSCLSFGQSRLTEIAGKYKQAFKIKNLFIWKNTGQIITFEMKVQETSSLL